MKDIAPILKSLGLIDSEVKTYLKSLEKGPSTVLELTKTTGLSRQAIYVAIDELTRRGLVSNVLRGKKKYYVGEHPSKLLSYARRREAEMKDQIADLARSLPELELQVGREKPTVRLFEGKEGVRAILEDVQASKPKNMEEITDIDAMYKILTPEDLKPYRDELKKMGTTIRSIHSRHPVVERERPGRVYLPDKFRDFKTNIDIYDDKIAMATFEGKIYSLIIESKSLTKTLRIIFDLAWESLKKANYRK